MGVGAGSEDVRVFIYSLFIYTDHYAKVHPPQKSSLICKGNIAMVEQVLLGRHACNRTLILQVYLQEVCGTESCSTG